MRHRLKINNSEEAIQFRLRPNTCERIALILPAAGPSGRRV
jgi:hypothetical protein